MTKTFEDKSRLVYLAYQVLNKIDVVVADKSDDELMAILASAFHRHATEVTAPELSQRRKPDLPEALIHPHPKGAA